MYSKMIRVGLISCAILFGLAASAQGQQPALTEKRALIKELLDVTEARKGADATMSAIFSHVERMAPELISQSVSRREGLTPKQREELRQKLSEDNLRITRRYKELFAQRIDLGQIIEDISFILYDKYFTENELKDLLAFYRSPTGKKTVETMPKLLTDSMTKAAEVLLPKIQQLTKEIMDEELKNAETTQPPPQDQKK